MPTPSNQTAGKPLLIDRQEIKFSRCPVRKKGNSYELQAEILTKNAWDAIEAAIYSHRFKKSPKDKKLSPRDVCSSFFDQAYYFYIAYEAAQRQASRPLLLYYSLMNLAKAFIVFRGVASGTELSNAMHGLGEAAPLKKGK